MMARKFVVRPRRPPVSFRIDLRAIAVMAVLGLIALAGMIVSVGTGEYAISPPDVIRTLLGIDTADETFEFVVYSLRLPRALVAFMVGVALAVSGAILQGMTRNPLAAPDIVGVTSGASLAAVLLIVAFPSVSAVFLPPAAFGGGIAVAAILYTLTWRGNSSPLRLILIGIGLTSITGAFTSVMITFGDIDNVSQALVWLAGSVYARSWEHVWPLVPWLLVFLPLAFLSSRHLNALELGDEISQGLGVRVELQRGLLLLSSVALAAAAVATAGTVGFVGLMAPHIARRLVGPGAGGLLPTAAMTGGALVVIADLVGSTILSPIEIPVGIITSILGAPFFLYLFYRNRNA